MHRLRYDSMDGHQSVRLLVHRLRYDSMDGHQSVRLLVSTVVADICRFHHKIIVHYTYKDYFLLNLSMVQSQIHVRSDFPTNCDAVNLTQISSASNIVLL